MTRPVLLVILALAASVTAARASPLSDLVAKLTAQAGSDDRATRDTAADSLDQLPQSALPVLDQALKRADLNDNARGRLERAAARIRYRARADAAADARREWQRATMTDAYDRFGRHTAKWDADARAAIAGCVDALNATDPVLARAACAKALPAARRALDSGCDDGLLFYAAGVLHQRAGEQPPLYVELFTRAADLLADPTVKYPPARLAYARLRAAESLYAVGAAQRATALIDQAVDLLPAALTKPPAPEEVLHDLPWDLIDLRARTAGDRKPGFDAVDAQVAKTFPDSYVLHVLRGRFYLQYAWDARTDKFAPDVPADAWEPFRDRLKKAAAELARAYEIDPTNCRAPDLMMSVELGQGIGKTRMETWYKRALAANPYDTQAAYAKLNYLDPKWYGSFQEMLNFAHELVDQSNWDTGLPTMLFTAHATIACYAGRDKGLGWQPDPEYFARPDVWGDLRPLFEHLLAHTHDSPAWATVYAAYAYQGRHWADADRALKLLADDRFDPRYIHSPEELQGMRAETAKHLADSPPAK